MSNVIDLASYRKTKQVQTVPSEFFDSAYDAAAQDGCDAVNTFAQDLGIATSAQQVAIGALSYAVVELGKAATLEVIDEILEWYAAQEDDTDESDNAG